MSRHSYWIQCITSYNHCLRLHNINLMNNNTCIIYKEHKHSIIDKIILKIIILGTFSGIVVTWNGGGGERVVVCVSPKNGHI